LGWLLISQGHTRQLFLWSVFDSIVSVLSFLVGLRFGPVTVAASYVVANIAICMPALVYWATRIGPVRASDLVTSVRLPAGVAASVFGSLVLFRSLFETTNHFVDLAVCMVVAAMVWLLVMWLTTPGREKLAFYWSSLVGKKGPLTGQ
jgi:PST family polysaccharide transporter